MNEVDTIFAAIGKAGAYVVLQDKRDSKAKQLRDVQSRRCGNCAFWMTRGCKPEKERGEFKSMNSPGCKDFNLTDRAGLIPKFEAEIKELDEEIAAFGI